MDAQGQFWDRKIMRNQIAPLAWSLEESANGGLLEPNREQASKGEMGGHEQRRLSQPRIQEQVCRERNQER